jgi:hypothetical protein
MDASRYSYERVTTTLMSEVQQQLDRANGMRSIEASAVYRDYAFGVYLAWEAITRDTFGSHVADAKRFVDLIEGNNTVEG